MRTLKLYFLAAMLTTQIAILSAQTVERPKPKFDLTISFFYPGGKSNPPGKLKIDETNTSNEPIVGPPCPEIRGVFHISVLLNGHPVQERDAAARKKREETTLCRQLPDGGTNHPGVHLIRYMGFGWDYPMT